MVERKEQGAVLISSTTSKIGRGRPKLPHVSEEMKRLAQLLETEILTWPNVTSRPMFGLNGIYRGTNIFAVLPRTRAMDIPDSIAFRLLKRTRHITAELHNDKRIVKSTPEAKWISFVMESDSEIHAALNWLALAYRQAAKS
jgi:hypothetical protein